MGAGTLAFVARRLGQGAVVVFAVATLVFVLLQAAPGDPLSIVEERISPEALERLRRNFGLDRPVSEQYVRYITSLARGDLGVSLTQHRPVLDALAGAIPNTLLLAAAALLVDFALGLSIGIFQATRPGTRTDAALSALSITLYSTPVFWLGLLLAVVFGQGLGWFPVGGATDPIAYASLSPAGRVLDRLHHLVLPALTLGLAAAGYTARHQRSALLEVMGQDFVRTARAKGLRERVVLLRHALRNALLPTITLAGLAFPVLLSGSVLVESVFSWPGMGRLAAEAIGRRDYPLVTGAALLAAVMVVLGSLLADLAARAADPRLRRA
jgi:ABC-type dipeptide/oligopeptide/nickel transport system permease component